MIIIKSKREVLITVLAVFFGIATGVMAKIAPVKTFSVSGDKKTVLIDAGHGMPDGGAVGAGGSIEQKLNLDIAQKTAEVLSGKGFKAIMTREDENSLAYGDGGSIREIKVNDMKKRKALIKESGAELFISIHMNSYLSEKASGLRVFYAANHSESAELAENIQKNISRVSGAKSYAVKTADKSLFLMKNPPVPSILIECGFISNPEEEKKLSDSEYQSKIAWAIADAIEKYF